MHEAFSIVLDRLQEATQQLERERVARAEIETEVRRLQSEVAGIGNRPSPQHVVDLIRAMADDRKIEAIKAFRTLTGYPLKESKDAIESVMGVYRAADAA